MATVRSHAWIGRPAAEVWGVVSDVGAISNWFPGIVESSAGDGTRSCMFGDVPIEEEIVTNDDSLRRLQYSITGGGIECESHLATVDVIDNNGGCLVMYSTDVKPDEMADMVGPALEGGVQGLKELCEGA